MLYQATRHIGDSVNGLEIPHGCYVDTECENWVRRMGRLLRPLRVGEAVKVTAKTIKIAQTLEDVAAPVKIAAIVDIEEPISDEDEVAVESVEEAVKEDSTKPTQRKIRPNMRRIAGTE